MNFKVEGGIVMAGFQWPEGYRSAALLTFDIDGVVGFEGSAVGSLANRPSVRSLAEYEPAIAIPRILEWLQQEQLSATFFVPGRMAEIAPESVRNIVNHGHEIGHHGHFHLKPDRVSDEQERAEIELALPVLERVTGQKMIGSRVPGWAPSAQTLKLLAEHGILYDSSLMGDDAPYRTAEGLLEIPCTWWMDDWEQWGYLPFEGWEYPMNDPQQVMSLWTTHFEGSYEVGGAFVLTLHPWISGRPGFLRVIAKTVETWRRSHPDVWWASCRDVYHHAVRTQQ
jgi:peptidoglycan/xylan/chitin deacetylase (PgdA/CDA1 family)